MQQTASIWYRFTSNCRVQQPSVHDAAYDKLTILILCPNVITPLSTLANKNNVNFAGSGGGAGEGSPETVTLTAVSHTGKLTEQTPMPHGDKAKSRGSGGDTGSHLCLNWDWLSLTRRPFTCMAELLGFTWHDLAVSKVRLKVASLHKSEIID